MDPQQAFAAIRTKPNGPIKKFELLKIFGKMLKDSGITGPRTLSCEEPSSRGPPCWR